MQRQAPELDRLNSEMSKQSRRVQFLNDFGPISSTDYCTARPFQAALYIGTIVPCMFSINISLRCQPSGL